MVKDNEKVNWSEFDIDTARAFVKKKLGSSSQIEKPVLVRSSAIIEKMLKAKPMPGMGDKASPEVQKKAIAKVVAARLDPTLKESFLSTTKGLARKDVTWGQFAEHVNKDVFHRLARDVAVEVLKTK